MSGRTLIEHLHRLVGQATASAARRRSDEAAQAHLDNLAGTDYEARKDDVSVDEYFPCTPTLDPEVPSD